MMQSPSEVSAVTSAVSPHAEQFARSGLQPLKLGGRTLLPIVQGGMGVGVSAHRLAGTVAQQGGVGTLSSVNLRRHHPDLMERTRGLRGEDAKQQINAANVEALQREIAAAKEISGGRGMLAVNVMRAVSAYAEHVKTALQAGIDAIVVGAGLPLDLPELAREHPKAALIPILSDARGVQLIVRKWERKQRAPDAVVLEHPGWAAGHLGAAKVEDTSDPRFDFERVVPETLEVLHKAGLDGQVPVIVAGGLRTHEDIRRMQALGASAVQFGTSFAVTEECDADDAFKHVLAEARDEDLVEFTSVAGLPARAVRTPWLQKYLSLIDKTQAVAHAKSRCAKSFDCLAQCGLRDGLIGWGQFCIDHQLAAALKGDLKTGLFFRGRGALPFGNQIRSVRALFDYLLTPAAA
ncbi:NAD(P)H-dependent flavin oxidoreductase [Methyloversatilis sp.]|uniref:NAD(P)H-dependent flavin oxidoreductase n=1 Tax=Methyloversatilis sp. TaxID=2569862 RepID=UPI003D27D67A